MPPLPDTGRVNQRRRTRKDLLAAAARLLKQGRTPDMDAVAAEAMVSRATAYRYFPSIDALLVEAPLDGAVPAPDDLFPPGDPSTDALERVDRAEAAMHASLYRNEPQLRRMLMASLDRKLRQADATNGADGGATDDPIPVRQNRRTPLIEAALAPARDKFGDDAYRKLVASLALVFGTEAMIVFSDVLALDEPTARATKQWAVRALVTAALSEATLPKPRRKR